MGNTVFTRNNGKRLNKTDQEEESNGIDGVEPIRASVAILAIQLVTLLVATDLLYVLVNYFLMKAYFLETSLSFNLHTFIVPILAVLHIAKSFFQISFIISIVMGWIGKSYFIVDKHLIKRDGIFTIAEKIYDLDNVRSVTVHQSLVGKMFHFGDVIVETSASGGYMDQITFTGVSDPQKFEHKILMKI